MTLNAHTQTNTKQSTHLPVTAVILAKHVRTNGKHATVSEYTKGPWEVRLTWFSDFQIWSAEGQVVAVDVISKENVQLIVAAPDMLEALEELTELMEGVIQGDYKPDSFTTQPARMAIAKATEILTDERFEQLAEESELARRSA